MSLVHGMACLYYNAWVAVVVMRLVVMLGKCGMLASSYISIVLRGVV
jgi:hypothetical protein